MKLLILRFSALGDVAMTVPVIDSLARQYPDLSITVLTRRGFKAMFQHLPANVQFHGIDLNDYRGIAGLNRLYRLLQAKHFTHVADLHDVLRTKYLRMRFRMDGKTVAVIDKGRRDKARLTRKRNKMFRPLPTSFERYRDVLSRLGLPCNLTFRSIFAGHKPDLAQLHSLTGEKGTDRWLGVAPFAKHLGKIYPTQRLEQVLAHFHRQPGVRVFLFGGGRQEQTTAEAWAAKYPGITSVIGQLDMAGELALMSRMDVMLTMDSGNMHLASLAGTPVVSVWGATHPFAGFMGWGQTERNAVQVALPCRPCSVFGQKPCYRGDYACLNGIEPEQIIHNINILIQ